MKSVFAYNILYIKSFLAEILIKDFVGARITLLDLADNIFISLLGTQKFNGWLNVILFAKQLSFLSLIFKRTLSLNNVGLSNHKLTLSAVRDQPFASAIQAHLSENPLLGLRLLITLEFSALEALLKCAEDPLFLGTELLLQAMLEEHAPGNRIDGLLVHLLEVLHKRAHRDLICWLEKTHMSEELHVSHVLDGLGNLTVDTSRQAGLVLVQDLSSLVHELCRVLPVDIILADSAHELASELSAGQRAVNEGRWLLLVKVELSLTSLNLVIIIEESLSIEYGVSISVFLLVLPGWEGRILFIDILVIRLIHGHCRIRSDVLTKSFFNYALN